MGARFYKGMQKNIQANGVSYIGKEANNSDDQPLKVQEAQVFINEEEIKDRILALTPEHARGLGIKYRSTLKKIKDNIKSGKKISLKTKAVRRSVENVVQLKFY